MKITTQEFINMVADVLEVESQNVTIDTAMGDLEEWDSLGQLGILMKLDEILGGAASGLRELAEAGSIEQVISVLKNAALHSGVAL